MKILLTGASGLIGHALATRLTQLGHELVVITRDPEKAKKQSSYPATFIPWGPTNGRPPVENLAELDGVIHLAGEPVAESRWSDAQKAKILGSRVQTTRSVLEAIRAIQHRPRFFISASAIGFYGDRGDEELNENSSAGDGFLPEVVQTWEKEVLQARDLCDRVLCLRIGLVLSREGGVLGKILPVFKRGLGGKLGSGKQWMSWVHIDDLIGLILFAIDHSTESGVMNITAPAPVTNAVFTKELAETLKKHAFLGVPEIALKLALGEMSTLLLESQRVLPVRAQELGFEFKYTNLRSALADLVGE